MGLLVSDCQAHAAAATAPGRAEQPYLVDLLQTSYRGNWKQCQTSQIRRYTWNRTLVNGEAAVGGGVYCAC